MLKIATWNVNSLRVRLPHVLNWLVENQPHILALQETKLVDADFPVTELRAAGYHLSYIGQKTYNGVAILSHLPAANIITDIPGYADLQRRVLGITVGEVRILNVYVPNGSQVGSEKYLYKLAWLDELTNYVQRQLVLHPYLVILGDFNIAPEEQDVYDSAAWQGQVLVSEAERQALQKLLQLGLRDTFRLFEQAPKSYTWWDYRMFAFKRNQGLRIDHILASEAFAARCISCKIDKMPRTWERPSDHAPVIAEFDMTHLT